MGMEEYSVKDRPKRKARKELKTKKKKGHHKRRKKKRDDDDWLYRCYIMSSFIYTKTNKITFLFIKI